MTERERLKAEAEDALRNKKYNLVDDRPKETDLTDLEKSLQQGLARVVRLLSMPDINVDTAKFVAKRYLSEGTIFVTGWEHTRYGIPYEEGDQNGNSVLTSKDTAKEAFAIKPYTLRSTSIRECKSWFIDFEEMQLCQIPGEKLATQIVDMLNGAHAHGRLSVMKEEVK